MSLSWPYLDLTYHLIRTIEGLVLAIFRNTMPSIYLFIQLLDLTVNLFKPIMFTNTHFLKIDKEDLRRLTKAWKKSAQLPNVSFLPPLVGFNTEHSLNFRLISKAKIKLILTYDPISKTTCNTRTNSSNLLSEYIPLELRGCSYIKFAWKKIKNIEQFVFSERKCN